MTYLYLVLTTIIWAAVFHLGKYAIAWLSPLSVATWRFVLSALALCAYVYLQRGWDGKALRRNLGPMLVMGVVGVFGFNVALFFGLQYTSPVNAALIMAFYPAITAILSARLNAEPVSARQVLGFLISLAGVVTIVCQGSLHNLLTLNFTRGDLLILLGCTCWAIYGVIPKRFVHDMPTLLLTTSTIVIGAAALSLVAAVSAPDLLVVPTPSVMLAIAAMGLLGTVVAYLWWNRSIAQLGAARVANFINLVPVFTTLMGVALGQTISGAQLVGAALVIAGVLTTTSNRRPVTTRVLVTES